jgi:aldose 1-epimerase
MAAQTDLVRLRHGPLELDLCPEIGGCITLLRHGGHDLMRPATAQFFAERDPREAATFPLVPFSNRIADARFAFQGAVYQLARNFPPEPHAIHGQGWQHAWTVREASATAAVLELALRLDGTPFDYRARQSFALSGQGLTVTLEIANAGAGPMPAGLGLHAYYIRSPAATLRTRLDQVWRADARKLPAERVPLPPAWDFSQAPRVATLEMDNCFDGWDGRAALTWPERDLRLSVTADPLFGHLVIYIPPGQDYFCVEPVSHVNDGFNLAARGVADTGVRVLAPGEQLSGAIRFTVEPPPPP